MIRIRTAVSWLALLVTAAACDDPPPPAETSALAQLPEEKLDTLMLEGMPEPVRLQLFEPPEDFPLAFATYHPDQMAAEVERDERGDVVRFVAEFGGEREQDAAVHVLVHPAGVTPTAARSLAEAFILSRYVLGSRGIEFPELRPEVPKRFPWALYEADFMFDTQERGWQLGTIGVGQHDGRAFHVIYHYPEDYAEGFVPRADLILSEWIWADGRRLEPRRPGA